MSKDKELKRKLYNDKRKKTINFWLIVILCTLPLIFTILLKPKMDNDLWYILSEGRYIVQNGLYKIDPLSMHQGLDITVQNWMSASIFWLCYNTFGFLGIFILTIICYVAIAILLYKICMLISKNNIMLSFIASFLTLIPLLCYYIVSRPQIFSFINLLVLIYTLELYIKNNNYKYLISIPIISLLQANMHASLWWMVFLFIIPYIIDSFKCPTLNLQGYSKKPLFIFTFLGLLAGLINPYGIKAITFIFTSFGNSSMHEFIKELQLFSLNDVLCVNMFIYIIIVNLIYIFFRKYNYRTRYICLFYGTMILGFISIKAFSHFTLVSLFPLAYFLKDAIPNDFSDMPKSFMNILKYFIISVGTISLGLSSILLITNTKDIEIPKDAENIVKELQRLNIKNVNIYSSFNNGGYLEFFGYKPYIDPRAEVFLKKNNHKEDIFDEYYHLQHDKLNTDGFLAKYDFDYLMIEPGDALFDKLNTEKYIMMYEDAENHYRLYGKKELFTEDELNDFVEKHKNHLLVYKKLA